MSNFVKMMPNVINILLLVCFSASSYAKLQFVWLAPHEMDRQARQQIEKSGVNEAVAKLSDRVFPFKETVMVRYGAKEGPLYDPDTHTIDMPYSFFKDSYRQFKQRHYEALMGRSALQGAVDTLMHTLLHELAHAYIAENRIPILGKEEDAADNFAALILIYYVEEGAEVAVTAADMFAFESEQEEGQYQLGEYMSEHSFDLQRHFSTLCLVYGSSPKRHHKLLENIEDEYKADRHEFCPYFYQQVFESWHTYLSSPISSANQHVEPLQ